MQDGENGFSWLGNINDESLWNLDADQLFDLGTLESRESDSSDEAENSQYTCTALLPYPQEDEDCQEADTSRQETDGHVFDYQLPESTSKNSPILEISNYEGLYQFRVNHPQEDPSAPLTKKCPWTYSLELDELYVDMMEDCPLLVQIKGSPPSGTYIKATPYYLRAQDRNGIPKRCPNHSAVDNETNKDYDAPLFLIRSTLMGTEYYTEKVTGRMSTIIPYIPSQFGSGSELYTINFMCRTSCSGGMNRRPICVVFTLEHNGSCLGRHVKKVRICACPGRDRREDERRSLLKRTSGDSELPKLAQDVKKVCKRIGSSISSNQNKKKVPKIYTLTVTNRAHYDILSRLAQALDDNYGNQDVSSSNEDDT